MKNGYSFRLVIWELVIIMSLTLLLGRCKKGNDDVVTPIASSVQGSWKISGYKIDPAVDFTGTGQKSNDLLTIFKALPNGNDLVDCLTSTVITFNSGGTITQKTGAKCNAATDMSPVEDNSTWKLDGSKLTITSGADVSVFDTVISGNTLKMSEKQLADFDGDGKEETYMVTLELTKV